MYSTIINVGYGNNMIRREQYMGYRVRNYPNNDDTVYPGVRTGDEMCHRGQKHVHELQGSVKIADEEEPHNHRFCTVTGEAIPCGENNHVHEVFFMTDFFEDHFHEFKGRTCPAIPVGDRHVHFIESVTTVNDGHRHPFEAATLINNPIGTECRREEKEEHNHRGGNY